MTRARTLTLAAAAALAIAAVAGTAYAHRAGGHGGGGHGGYYGGGYHHGGGHGGRHWRKHRRHHHGMHRRLKRLQERYDTNDDGKVTQAEIDSNRRAWLKEFDKDNDGALNLEEFKQLWLKARDRRAVRAFQRFDRDGNADVTLDEYMSPLSDLVEMRDRNGDGALSREDLGRRHGGWRRHRDMDERMDSDDAPQADDDTPSGEAN